MDSAGCDKMLEESASLDRISLQRTLSYEVERGVVSYRILKGIGLLVGPSFASVCSGGLILAAK
jgi:hypothetical protein